MARSLPFRPEPLNYSQQTTAQNPTPPGLTEPTGTIPVQQVDLRLRDRLPADVKQSGFLVAVNSGVFPPYELIQPDGTVRGASADLVNALGQLWGIDIKHATVDGPISCQGIVDHTVVVRRLDADWSYAWRRAGRYENG